MAVAAVILFHLGVTRAAGGFVGVDAFFVLSGFLITGLILREHERTGRIDLTAFYARRVRRILPAALLTIVVTVAVAAVVLAPLDVPNVTLDGAAAALSVGNVRFAVTSTDYFGPTAPSPFRHFWSLGVEEQFYLVWPTLLGLALWRHGSRRRVAIVLAAVVAGSLGLSIWLTGIDAPLAFYSLPTRAWQLGLGGLLAATARPASSRSDAAVEAAERGLRERLRRLRARTRTAIVAAGWAAIACLGLGGIVAAVVLLDGSTPYPGTAALLPSLATAALILAGERTGPARWLLVRPPVRWLGRISYSLYLWHWPILVLPALALGRDLTPIELVPLATLSIAAGWASWRFVEEPFRRGWSPSISRRRTLVAGLSAAALTAIVAVSVGNGILSRLPASAYGASTAGSAGVAGAPAAADAAVPQRESYETLVGASGPAWSGATPSAAPSGGAPSSPPASSVAASTSSAAAGPSASASPAGSSSASLSSSASATGAAKAASIPAPAYLAPTGAVPLPANVAPPLVAARNDMDPIVNDGCGLAIDGSTPPICVYGKKNGAVTVALVGDSHADHWFPALLRLADENGWRLVPLTKYSCPFVDMRIWGKWFGREYTECEQWRPKVVTALQRLKPDLVIVSGHRWFQTIVAGDDDPTLQGRAEARLLAQVPGRIVVLADTPIARVDVPACLSAHLADIRACASDRAWAFGSQPGLRDRTAARLVGAAFLSMDDAICPGTGPCPAVLRGMIVYRDDHHLTATFARSLAPLLGARLLAIDPALGPSPSPSPSPRPSPTTSPVSSASPGPIEAPSPTATLGSPPTSPAASSSPAGSSSAAGPSSPDAQSPSATTAP